MLTLDVEELSYQRTIDEISKLDWEGLTEKDFIRVAWAYYFFSIQFRENLEIACQLHPEDEKLAHLRSEECDTDNLSPWPGVAVAGERMNHDEFMRRLLDLSPISVADRHFLQARGDQYLTEVRGVDAVTSALSIASYEDGGLERTFRAMSKARAFDNPLLLAFRHFLLEHIRFDSDPDEGHGALSRHLTPDDRIAPLWTSFRNILVDAAPSLMQGQD